ASAGDVMVRTGTRTPVASIARARTAPSPRTMGTHQPAAAGSASDLTMISGPMPAASPIVIATRGRFSVAPIDQLPCAPVGAAAGAAGGVRARLAAPAPENKWIRSGGGRPPTPADPRRHGAPTRRGAPAPPRRGGGPPPPPRRRPRRRRARPAP